MDALPFSRHAIRYDFIDREKETGDNRHGFGTSCVTTLLTSALKELVIARAMVQFCKNYTSCDIMDIIQVTDLVDE